MDATGGSDLRVQPLRDTRLLLDMLTCPIGGTQPASSGGSRDATDESSIPSLVSFAKAQLAGCGLWADRPDLLHALGRKVWNWHATAAHAASGKDR